MSQRVRYAFSILDADDTRRALRSTAPWTTAAEEESMEDKRQARGSEPNDKLRRDMAFWSRTRISGLKEAETIANKTSEKEKAFYRF